MKFLFEIDDCRSKVGNDDGINLAKLNTVLQRTQEQTEGDKGWANKRPFWEELDMFSLSRIKHSKHLWLTKEAENIQSTDLFELIWFVYVI